MKKIVIFLILFVACHAFAQKSSRAFFDFTDPQHLTPSITPGAQGGDVVVVTDKQFTDRKVKVSFLIGDQLTGAQILTDMLTHEPNTVYYLRITATASMVFSSTDGAVIDSIRFSNDTDPGDLYLDNSAGTFDPFQGYKFWTADNKKNVTSVKLTNSYRTPRIEQVTVYYTEPTDVLRPNPSIQSGDIVPSFKDLSLTFTDNMSIQTENNIVCSKIDGTNPIPMHSSVNGHIVNLSLDSPINTDGTYKITIPARCFRSADGYENAALEYTITVETPKNILNYVSVDPEQGNVEKLTNVINLHYPSYIKIADGKEKVTIKCDNEDIDLGEISIDDTHKKAVLSFTGLPEEITDEGEYTIAIPEGTIINNMGTIWNPAFTLTYTISSTSEPPTPADPTEDTETMKKAKELLLQTGVGYPSKDSEAYKALAALVESEEIPADDALQAAINALYNETNVQMPEAGNYYKIAGKNAAGTTLYLTCTNDNLSLSSKSEEAAAFEAIAGSTDGEYLFHIGDGKYLSVLDITEDESLRSLTLSKMLLEDSTAEKLYGCMTITGDIKNIGGKIFTVPALISYAESKTGIATDATMTDLYFNNNLSNAFVITETNKPVTGEAIEATYTITPDEVENSKEVLTLSFTKPSAVKLANGSLPYFANASGEEIETADIFAVSDTENQFSIRLDGLQAGDYSIVLPEGTFTCVDNGVTKNIKAISKNFKIKGSGSGTEPEVDPGFSYTYNSFFVYKFQNNANPVKDVELNEIYFYISPGFYTDMIPDPSKTVKIVSFYNIKDVKRKGHFVKAKIPELEDYPAIKLILDEPIKAGDLKKGSYGVLIEKGTYGDENFGKYLQDNNSVKASDCKVNPAYTYQIDVDNNFVSGIIDANVSDTSGEKVIYDLTGRRVQSMSRPGVYIVNGKKVVVGK